MWQVNHNKDGKLLHRPGDLARVKLEKYHGSWRQTNNYGCLRDAINYIEKKWVQDGKKGPAKHTIFGMPNWLGDDRKDYTHRMFVDVDGWEKHDYTVVTGPPPTQGWVSMH